jgi:tetratricopeptide (TPR) repeat protein
MRVCIEVKDNNTEHFRLFVDFLRRWFSTQELRARFESAAEPAGDRFVDRRHLEAAVHACTRDRREFLLEAIRIEVAQALLEERYADAVAAAKRVAEEQGEARDFYALSLAELRSEDHDAAAEAARAGLHKFPDDALLHDVLGRALLEKNDLANALAEAERAMALSATETMHLCLRGEVLMAMGRYEDVLANEDRLLEIEPDHSHSYFLKVRALMRLGRIEEGASFAQKVAEDHPTWTDAWVTLASVAQDRHRYGEEVSALERVLALAPDDRRTLRRLGHALLNAKRYEDAYRNSERLLALDPNDHCGLEVSAWASWDQGRAEDAEKAALRLLEVDSSSREGLHVLAHVYRSAGKVKQAIDMFNRAIALGEDRVWPYAEHAEMLLAQGQLEQALSALEPFDASKAGVSTRIAARVHVLRGTIMLAAGRYVSAGEEARAAISLGASGPDARLLECKALVGSSGLAGAMNAMAEVLTDSSLSGEEEDIPQGIAEALHLETRLRGPGSIGRASRELRRLIEGRAKPAVIGQVLTAFGAELLAKGEPRGDEWSAAIPLLIDAFGDIPECRIALALLKTGNLYLNSGDEGDLLSLPLEQRTLLRDALRKGSPARLDQGSKPDGDIAESVLRVLKPAVKEQPRRRQETRRGR